MLKFKDEVAISYPASKGCMISRSQDVQVGKNVEYGSIHGLPARIDLARKPTKMKRGTETPP